MIAPTQKISDRNANSRPLPESYRDSWGAIEAGAIRGGVPAVDGWRDVAALQRARRDAAAAGATNAGAVSGANAAPAIR